MRSAFLSIGEDRRFPYEAIYWTVITLESLFIALNVLVLVASQTRFIKSLRNLKFYIEGRLFGALFISAVTLSIYMSLRRGINMHGTLQTTTFGHYGGPPKASMELTFKGAVHGKQLSAHDEHCHYIPKKVFENPEDYSYNQTLCAHGHLDGMDALSEVQKAEVETLTNATETQQTAYDDLVQALVDAEAALQAAEDDGAINITLASLESARDAAQTALDNDGGQPLADAKEALSEKLRELQPETLYGTCCLLTEFESSGSNGTTTYTGWWVILAGISLQVVIFGVQKMLTDGELEAFRTTVQNVQNVLERDEAQGKTGPGGLFDQTHIPRGFKTIRVV